MKITDRVAINLANVLHDKGYYATEAALNTAYPTANDGDFARVGSTDTVWVWDSGTVAWVNSTIQGTVTSIDGKTGAIDARYTQSIFFGKGGSDGDDGRSYIQRKSTIAAAKTAASALTPAADNQIAIVCCDAGTYTENYVNEAYVHLIASAIKITGNILCAENCIMEIGILDGNLAVSASKVLRCTIYTITGSVTKTGKIRGQVGDDFYSRDHYFEA